MRQIVYNIFMDGKHLYSSDTPWRDSIINPVYELQVNKAGSFTFTMPRTHPLINEVYEMKSWVTIVQMFYIDDVKQTETIPFFGRVYQVEEDLIGNKNITCEGFLSVLNDVYYDFKNNSGRTSTYTYQIFDIITSAYNASAPIQNSISSFSIDNTIYKTTNTYTNDDNLNTYSTTAAQYPELLTDYSEDAGPHSLMDLLNTILDEGSGFIMQTCRSMKNGTQQGSRIKAVNRIIPFLFYYPYNIGDLSSSTAYGGLINYPNETISDVGDNQRRYWIPKFYRVKNVLSFSKEQSMSTKFSGVFPVGKDDLKIASAATYNQDTFCLWNQDLINRYGSKIAITLEFPDIDNQSRLRSVSQQWLNKHSKDSEIPYKYTVTGPEPCVLGYGDIPVMLMRDVLVDDSEKPIGPDPGAVGDYGQLPCLSIKIDIQNPQNNQYIIGPFIDTNYTKTSISTESARTKRSKK